MEDPDDDIIQCSERVRDRQYYSAITSSSVTYRGSTEDDIIECSERTQPRPSGAEPKYPERQGPTHTPQVTRAKIGPERQGPDPRAQSVRVGTHTLRAAPGADPHAQKDRGRPMNNIESREAPGYRYIYLY